MANIGWSPNATNVLRPTKIVAERIKRIKLRSIYTVLLSHKIPLAVGNRLQAFGCRPLAKKKPARCLVLRIEICWFYVHRDPDQPPSTSCHAEKLGGTSNLFSIS